MEFLNQVTQNSLTYKMIASRRDGRLANNERLSSELDGVTRLGFEASQAKPVPSAQFSIDSQRTVASSATYQRLWRSGWRTELSYTLAQDKTDLANLSREVYEPDLRLSASTNVFQDYLSDRYHLLENRQKQGEKVIEFDAQEQKKSHLAAALLNLAGILETADELALQGRLCRQIRRQTALLKVKGERGSVSKRDYLQSQREGIICQSLIKGLDKELITRKDQLYSVYGVSFTDLKGINIDAFYTSVKQAYQACVKQSEVEVGKQPAIQSLVEQEQLLGLELEDLRARDETSLELTFAAGLKGSDPGLGESQTTLVEGKYPYVTVGLSYEISAGRDIKSQIGAKAHEVKVLFYRKAIARQELEGRFRVLAQTLERDFGIFADRVQGVRLSERILGEADRDFTNGRLDFNTLTEYQKALLEGQKGLANTRIQIIRNTIEYIDFFGYFASYY